MGTKHTAMTQEVIRILLNCRRELKCNIKQMHLNNLMQRMKNSGYNKEFRIKVLRAGINRYNKILEADKMGTKPMYRTKEWKSAARRMEKRTESGRLGSFYKSCIFPPAPHLEEN